jgi:hypothetical protein
MPQIVQPDRPDTGALDEPLERLAERMRVDRCSILPGGDQVTVLVVGVPLGLLRTLLLTMRPEQFDGLPVQINHPGVVALGRRLDHLVGDRDDGLTHGQPRRIEVDIGPAQTQDFAPTHPSHCSQPPHGGKPLVAD